MNDPMSYVGTQRITQPNKSELPTFVLGQRTSRFAKNVSIEKFYLYIIARVLMMMSSGASPTVLPFPLHQ